MAFMLNRLTLGMALAAVLALTGCDRYIQRPQCGTHIQPGDLGNWTLGEAGTARQSGTKLVWYRCNAGERFAGGQCIGEAMMLTLDDAKAYVAEVAAASGKPWRLPTRSEMADLREEACINPAVNPQVFPSIMVDHYWAADRSPNGPRHGCSFYTFNGNSFCRESIRQKRPFWIVLDQP